MALSGGAQRAKLSRRGASRKWREEKEGQLAGEGHEGIPMALVWPAAGLLDFSVRN